MRNPSLTPPATAATMVIHRRHGDVGSLPYGQAVGEIGDRVEQHLHGLAGPYLFVGSGIARRYAGLEDWEGLLRHFAGLTGQDYGYFRSLAGPGDDRLPTVASHIAEAFLPVWWRDDAYAESREEWKDRVDGAAYVLKVKIAKYLTQRVAESSVLPDLETEFKLFQNVVVEGVITTNYDPLLDTRVFPDFKVFVGQDELLFADTQGIAETYKIHGSVERPASLVLTAEDYRGFQRSQRLPGRQAADDLRRASGDLPRVQPGRREHPLDPAVHRARASGPQREPAAGPADLRGVGDPSAIPSMTETIHVIDGASVPILRVVVPDFMDLFTVLGKRERALPARVLRLLKEQVFEIVGTTIPVVGSVAISDMDDPNAESLDVVFGVGAKITRLGLVGLSRFDVADDVLSSPDRELPAQAVLDTVIAKVPYNVYVPLFEHLPAGWAPRRDWCCSP